MLVTLLDANSEPHVVTWRGQDLIIDGSGALIAGSVGAEPAPQPVAVANPNRAGFLFQNTSQSAMLFYEAGDAVAGWLVNSGAFFPPNDSTPIPTGIIYVMGTAQSEAGDTFTYREWINAVGE